MKWLEIYNVMKVKLQILIITMISIHTLAFSQKKIEGIIVDIDGDPLCYATVSEINVATNALNNTILSDTLGRFSIFIQDKEPCLFITSIGHKSKKIFLTENQQDMKIIMETDTMLSLAEVTVVAQKPQIKLTADRLIYDMSSNPLKDNNTLAALKFVPLIYSNEESFSIIGKDRTDFYINGRKSNMNQEALIAYLKILPAESIKNIEVITTPNSTFRGEGNFGVINIQLKDNENDGLKGMFSGQIWKTHYVKERGSLDLNYQKGRFMTDFSVGVTHSSDWKENTINSVYKETGLNTSTQTVTDGNNTSYFANFRTDYQLKESQIIGLIVNTRMESGRWTESGQTKFKNQAIEDIDSLVSIDYYSKSRNPEVAINANYRLSIHHTQYLTIDLDYLNNYNKLRSDNIMYNIDEEGNSLSLNKNFRQITPHRTNIYSGKIEYGNALNDNLNIKSGFDTYYSNINFNDKYTNWQNDQYVPDTLQSNEFTLKEWTSALFAHADKKWSSRFSTSLGARLEYTQYKGVQHTTKENINDEYFKLLPVLYVDYKASDNHKFNYNLSYRIVRPPFKELNPFKVYTSPNSYKTGNPFLKPATRISNQLQYLFFNKYYLTGSYDVTDDIINHLQIIKGENLIETKPVNLGKSKEFKLSFNTTMNYLESRASLNFNIAYNWMQVKGNSEGVNLDYTIRFLNLYLYNYFLLSKKHDLSIDFGGNFSTKQKYANVVYPSVLNMNAQLNKKIKNWQLGLYCFISSSIYDSNWTLIGRRIYDTEDLQTVTLKKGEAISTGIRISYSFGDLKVKGTKQRNTSNSEVKSRVN